MTKQVQGIKKGDVFIDSHGPVWTALGDAGLYDKDHDTDDYGPLEVRCLVRFHLDGGTAVRVWDDPTLELSFKNPTTRELRDGETS